MSIYDKASLVQIPSGYKGGTLYSVVPNDADGDFDFTRASTGTRVNKDGLIETIAADTPRLNYPLLNGVVQDNPTLLLEPQRINIYTYSEDLSQGTTLTNTSVDETSIVSPDGALTGNKLTQTSGAYLRKNLSVVLSGTYAWSFFAKKGDLRYLNARSLFVLNGITPANGNTIIDLDTNTIAYKGTNVTSATIEQYPNDWIKVEIVATDNATASGDFVDFFFTDSASSTQSTGVAGNGYIWGVQFESGSYLTSYIPTTTAVTRTVDTVKLENFANMPTDYPFTVYSNNNVDLINTNQWAWSILDISSAVKYLGLAFTNSGFIQIHRRNSANDVDSITTPVTQGQDFKFAITFISNTSYKYSINGGSTVTVTGADDVDFDFNDFLIGQQRVSSDTGNRNQCTEFMLFNEELSDAELITLTS